MVRWVHAARTLGLPLGSRVLDLGCAFGFGTRYLPKRYETYGHDLDPAYIERARKLVPAATFTWGAADRVPYADSFFDGVLLLDVIEHVPDEGAAIEEITRLLRPGGRLILSTPNRGALERLDSLNVYQGILGDRAMSPTDDPSWHVSPRHRHYSLSDVRALLGDRFTITSVRYTGLGIAEIIHLQLLVIFRALLRSRRLYNWTVIIYVLVYMLEDLVPAGDWGYHMMLYAERI